MSWLGLIATLGLAQANPLDPDLPEWILGVNEAVSVPPALSKQPDAEKRLDDFADLTLDAGVRYVRLNASSTPRLHQVMRQQEPDWARVDRAMQRLGERGIGVIVVMMPWPANDPWLAVDDCGIDHPASWTRRVQTLVERYDGDGQGDTEGAAKVIAWEVDNEPDLHDQMQPGFCPPEMHVETVAITAAAIREADPDAKVLNGGFYRPHSRTGATYMQATADAGLGDHIDGVSIHLYPSTDNEVSEIERAIDNTRASFGDRPIWLTETSTIGHGSGKGTGGEAEQARAMTSLVAAARRGGISAIFWHTLTDPPKGGHVPSPGLYSGDETSKLKEAGVMSTTGWSEKLGLTAFRHLATAMLQQGADEGLRWIQVTGGKLVWSETHNGDVGSLPGEPEPIAGGKVREKGEDWRVEGLAFIPD